MRAPAARASCQLATPAACTVPGSPSAPNQPSIRSMVLHICRCASDKGYGLGMLVEILSSVFSDASVGPDVPRWNTNRTQRLNLGHCFIVIDPKRFMPGFTDRLESYLRRMHGLPGHVRVPGDPEKAAERDAAQHGVPLHSNVAISLKALAIELDVPVPSEFAELDISNAKKSIRAREGKTDKP